MGIELASTTQLKVFATLGCQGVRGCKHLRLGSLLEAAGHADAAAKETVEAPTQNPSLQAASAAYHTGGGHKTCQGISNVCHMRCDRAGVGV
jgi:hypothetical protein